MATRDDIGRYTEHDPMTRPGDHGDALRSLPARVPLLAESVRGLMIHKLRVAGGDIEFREAHETTLHLRAVEDLLAHLLADGLSLDRERPPRDRYVGVCRHFTVLSVAALRAHGVPARARCGFAAYFPVPNMEDHWVTEYWDSALRHWVLADTQLGEDDRQAFGVDIDFHDVPRDQFVVAGEAWRRCREGTDDPDRYGYDEVRLFGAWWIAGNLIRDVAALSGMPMLPWDFWGAMPAPGEPVPDDLARLCDELADITADPGTASKAIEFYERDSRLRVPELVHNALRDRLEPGRPS